MENLFNNEINFMTFKNTDEGRVMHSKVDTVKVTIGEEREEIS